jgi:hypothetical protein
MKSPALGLALLALIGCSSESAPSGTPQATSSAFDKYCKGTLKVSKEYMSPVGPSTWSGNGATVPAGTSIVLGRDFGRFEAFAFLADGSVVKIKTGFGGDGLVAGTDFDSTCADRASDRANERTVLLRRSTFYIDAGLTGASCALDAGQVMTNFAYASSGAASASVSSAEIQATCGLSKSYSKDITYGTLIAL